MLSKLALTAAVIFFPSVAHAQWTAEAKCGSRNASFQSAKLVDAVNGAYYKAAGGTFAPKDCELVKITGPRELADASGKCFGGLSISPSGHFGRAFRKCGEGSSEDEARATAEGFCHEATAKDGEKSAECKTFVGRNWLAGVRCREGEGKDSQLREVGFSDDKTIVKAVTAAFRQGANGKLKVSNCKLRTIHDASVGKLE